MPANSAIALHCINAAWLARVFSFWQGNGMIRAYCTIALPTLCALALAGCSLFDNADDAAGEAALASSQLQVGALNSARKHIVAAVAIRDDVSDYWVLRAQIATARGDGQEAFDSYRTVIALDRANAEALRALCQLGNRFAQPAELDRFADQLAVLAPNDILPTIAHGYAALARGNLTAANRFADQALATTATDPGALVLKSQTLRRNRKFSEAADLIKRAAASLGPSPSLFDALAQIYDQARDRPGYATAIADLAKASPANSDPALELADLQYQDGDRDAARATVADIVKRNPGNIEIASRLLDLWLRQPGALTPAEIVSDSADASLLMRAAYAQYANEQRRPDIALKILGPAGKAGFIASTLDAQTAFAEALALTGATDPARRRIEAVLAVDPTQPRALIARSRLGWARGDRKAAISDIRQVVTDDADNATARILLAAYLDATGETALSMSALRDGMTAAPNSTRIAGALVRMLLTRGKRDAAADVLNDLAAAAPLDLRALRMRRDLCPSTGAESCRGPVKFPTV